MKVALMSHRGGNIGHDFMAAGWEIVLRDAFGAQVAIEHFEQHRPFEVYRRWHPVRLAHLIPAQRAQPLLWKLDDPALSARLWSSARPLQFDAAIACGGPNIAPGVGRSPQMGLMFHHLPGAFRAQGVPTVDAAVGAAFPYHSPPERITEPEDRSYYARVFQCMTKSTARDSLAQQLFAELGRAAPLLPCASIASGRLFDGLPPDRGRGHVLINFQERGANTDWGQGVDPEWWRATMGDVIDRLLLRHQVVFLCHNDTEQRLARRLRGGIPTIVPKTVQDYSRAISGAKGAIVSRLHAALPLAGAGVASIVVGTDTRLLAAKLIGLPVRFVKDLTVDSLEHDLENLVSHQSPERQRLLDVRDDTINGYAKFLMETAT